MSESSKRSVPVDPGRLAQVESLLKRYPDLVQNERQEILLFLRKGRLRDRGLLTANQSISDELEAFRNDHDRELSLSWGEFFVIALIIMLAVVAAASLWHI